MLGLNQSEHDTVISASRQCLGNPIVLPGEVERALHSTGYRGLRTVEIAVDGEVVFLRGHVPSYHMKQVAQTVAHVLPGVRKVQNELSVGCFQ